MRSVASRPLASHSKHFGEGARSGNAGTVATLHLARNQAGGAKSEAFRHRLPCCFSPRARALTASIVMFGARRPHWREVVLSSSCASERVRRSSQCGGSRDCQSPLQWRRALPCLVSCRNKAFASGCCCLHWAQHMLKCSSWALCGAAGCGAHVIWPSDGA